MNDANSPPSYQHVIVMYSEIVVSMQREIDRLRKEARELTEMIDFLRSKLAELEIECAEDDTVYSLKSPRVENLSKLG